MSETEFLCPVTKTPCVPKCEAGMLDLCYADAIERDPSVLRRIRADVWDEGYHRGVRDEAGDIERADNPYRAPDEPARERESDGREGGAA